MKPACFCQRFLISVTIGDNLLCVSQFGLPSQVSVTTRVPGIQGIYKKSSSGIVPTLQKSGIDNGKVGLIMGECD